MFILRQKSPKIKTPQRISCTLRG